MPWAEANEFAHYLVAAGLRGTTPTAIQQALDLAGALDAALNKWEDLTHYWPFLSTGNVNVTRYFDGPNGRLLDINGGLVVFTSLETNLTYQTNGSLGGGTSQINIRDFKLKPTDAAPRRKPWTYIEIGWWWHQCGQIGVTGDWGYCTEANLPSAARRAVMALAAITLAPQIISQLTRGGLIRLEEGDSKKQWGDVESLRNLFQADVDAALAQGYVRRRVA